MLVPGGPTNVVLNRHRWGLPPWSSEYENRPLSLLQIRYSPLSPSCPARSRIETTRNHASNIIHIEPPSWEGTYREWLLTTRLLPVAYFTKHSHSIVLIHRGGNQGILVGFSLMQLSFHRIPIRKCTTIAGNKVCNVKSYRRLCNRCLPCSRERELVSTQLGECCPPIASWPRVVLEPICNNMHECSHYVTRRSSID
jgi:hypothetical protein